MSNVKEVFFQEHTDKRGSLIALESLSEVVPFEVKRVYYIYGTKFGYERGFHAHLKLKQLLICLSGTVDIQVWSTRDNSKTYRLDSPNKGVFEEGLIWRVMKNFSSDAVLLILASEHYDKADYIFDFNKFASICDSYSTDEPVLD